MVDECRLASDEEVRKKAIEDGSFKEEITPVSFKLRKEEIIVEEKF